MKKFSNVYNSFWLILVTMTTSNFLYLVGYGDIYPTTYFGRLLALIACFFGTFVISLLVVFLNTLITFDDAEKHVYNMVIDQKTDHVDLRKKACSLIFRAMLYNYLKNKKKAETKMYRVFLLLDMNYKVKDFKLYRL